MVSRRDGEKNATAVENDMGMRDIEDLAPNKFQSKLKAKKDSEKEKKTV